jgi:CRP/FNR family transcriptional regulator
MVRKKEAHQAKGSPGRSGALRRVPCLGALDPAVLIRLQREARIGQYRRGDILFREGAMCNEILVITKGSVKVYRLSNEGRQQTLSILGAGDCFCLAPLFMRRATPAPPSA